MRSMRAIAAGLILTAISAPSHAVDNISGTWWADSYSARLQVLGGGDPPLSEAGKAAYAKNQAGLKNGSIEDKARKVCVPDGVPRVMATPYPFQIFQVPADQVTFLFEMNHQTRTIILNRPLPKLESLETDLRYQGHSVAHWEGEILLVETTGFNDRTFLDATGLPHSESLTLVERIRKIGERLEDVITIKDPVFYTRDWQVRFVYDQRNDVRLEDYACGDNHRDLSAIRRFP